MERYSGVSSGVIKEALVPLGPDDSRYLTGPPPFSEEQFISKNNVERALRKARVDPSSVLEKDSGIYVVFRDEELREKALQQLKRLVGDIEKTDVDGEPAIFAKDTVLPRNLRVEELYMPLREWTPSLWGRPYDVKEEVKVKKFDEMS